MNEGTSGIGQNVAMGTMQGEKLEVKTSHSITLGMQAFVLLALLVAAGVVCMVFVVKQARLTEVTALRVDAAEAAGRLINMQARADAEAQKLASVMENHNKLVQAVTQVFAGYEAKVTTLEAKVSALEAKTALLESARTNAVVKPEAVEDSGKRKK